MAQNRLQILYVMCYTNLLGPRLLLSMRGCMKKSRCQCLSWVSWLVESAWWNALQYQDQVIYYSFWVIVRYSLLVHMRLNYAQPCFHVQLSAIQILLGINDNKESKIKCSVGNTFQMTLNCLIILIIIIQHYPILQMLYVNIQIYQNHTMDKKTPQKHSNPSNKHKKIDDALAKDLLSPYYDTLSTSTFPSFTPLNKQPQYLLSPSPVKRDLFSQLLGTQLKHNSPYPNDNQSIIEQQSLSYEDCQFSSQSIMDIEEQGLSQNEGNWEEDGIKKRKRKSTGQIKLLKQELDGEMNWTKDKIVHMSKITGLSQSQVYKWCWDQKKKQIKHKQESSKYYERRKFIKKDLSYRNKYNYHKYDDESSFEFRQFTENDLQTKPKASYKIEQDLETEKKVKKRLVFN